MGMGVIMMTGHEFKARMGKKGYQVGEGLWEGGRIESFLRVSTFSHTLPSSNSPAGQFHSRPELCEHILFIKLKLVEIGFLLLVAEKNYVNLSRKYK